jgi:hypothetical protein
MKTTISQLAGQVDLQRRWCLCCLALGLYFSAGRPLLEAQTVKPFGVTPVTLQGKDRALEDIFSQVRKAFKYPIYYEELPLEHSGDLVSVKVAGFTPALVSPVNNLTVTLSEIDSTPYLAVQSVLSAYAHAGYPGTYGVFQRRNRIDVLPSQVRSSTGSLRTITPILTQPISFPIATRTVADTLQIILDAASKQSGYKILIVRAPTPHFQSVELGATGQSLGDVLEDLSTALSTNYSISFRFVPDTKTYYFVAGPSAPPDLPGVSATQTQKVAPTHGPADSLFFIKAK